MSGASLDQTWPRWRLGLGALAVWGLTALVLAYRVKGPHRLSRTPALTVLFAGLMTVLGSASYWATTQLYPLYRVNIERAALFVAVCTLVALLFVGRLAREEPARAPRLEWDFARLRLITWALLAVSIVGTGVTLGRIGYFPMLAGDPDSARTTFPVIGGIWYRLSLLGGTVAMLVAVQVCARQARWHLYLAGVGGLAAVSVYGPRFFVALPLGVAVVLWDRFRQPIRLRWALGAVLLLAPLVGIVGFWRERMVSVTLLRPVAQLVYGTFQEFRDLGWALDYYSLGDHWLHGATLGSVVVPLAPAPVWQVLGIDKAAVYAQSSASVLAGQMGAATWQRIGLYGEFYMNFGWTGALFGAALYGMLLGWLDRQLCGSSHRSVIGIFLAIAIAAAVFAQVGQLDMFTSTVTGSAYPLLLVVFLGTRRGALRAHQPAAP